MRTPKLQQVTDNLLTLERDRRRRTAGILSGQLLRWQNALFAGTAGVSRNNRQAGFLPGYYNAATGTSVPSRYADGRPAPVHVLDGLPEDWVLERDAGGHVAKARPGVIAGFLRGDRFYTREQAILALSH